MLGCLFVGVVVCVGVPSSRKNIYFCRNEVNMASSKTCDICGEGAVDTVDAGSLTTTRIKIDICQKHLEQFKRFMRILLRGEAVVSDDLLERLSDMDV